MSLDFLFFPLVESQSHSVSYWKSYLKSSCVSPRPHNRDLKIRPRRRQREHHKSNRFNQQNNNFCTCITLFCKFLCRHCTTTTWKCLISRRTEEVCKRRRNFLSLSELGYGSWEFNFRRVRLHLTKLATWTNRHEDWKNANSLFQRRFLCHRRPQILRSLKIYKKARKES